MSIHEHEAELLNNSFVQTGKYYELEEEKKIEKSSVREQADVLGIKYHHAAKDETIQKLIDQKLNQ